MFEVCVATPFGPHVVATCATRQEADAVLVERQQYQQARMFVRESHNDVAKSV